VYEPNLPKIKIDIDSLKEAGKLYANFCNSISRSMQLYSNKSLLLGNSSSKLALESTMVRAEQVERKLSCSSRAHFQTSFGPRKLYDCLLSLLKELLWWVVWLTKCIKSKILHSKFDFQARSAGHYLKRLVIVTNIHY